MIHHSAAARWPALVLAGLLSALTFIPADAIAASQFDGRWTVTLRPGEGSCGSGRAVSVNVADGQVTYAGAEQVTASGTIPESGRVSLRFAYEGDVLDARGSVRGGIGQGSWDSPTGRCTGSWTARRSG